MTPLGKAIAQGLREGIAHMRGEIKLRSRVVYVDDATNVRQTRHKTGLSQSQFAERFGFNLRTLQDWEQGRVQLDSAMRAYLTVIRENPAAVEKALRKAS